MPLAEKKGYAVFDDYLAQGIPNVRSTLSQGDVFSRRSSFVVKLVGQYVVNPAVQYPIEDVKGSGAFRIVCVAGDQITYGIEHGFSGIRALKLSARVPLAA
jgi:hypothetical protein